MKFSGVITNDRSDVYANVQGQRSKVKVTEVKTQISRFGTITPVWDFTYGDEMILKAWYCLAAVPYWFSRSSVKFQGHTPKKNNRFRPKLGVSGLYLQFEFTDGFEMIYKAWSSIEEVPYCLSRSSIKFHGHTGQKIANFDPNWAFLDCDYSLNSPMGLKWCTKLGVQKRCPIVFRGHPSNLKVTWTEKSMIWIQFLAAIKFPRFACKYPIWYSF